MLAPRSRVVQLEKREMPYWFEPTETTIELGQHTVKIETGRIAKQAAGSVVVSCGGTSVLVTAVHSSPRPGIDFFPLTVDFVEKFAAAGKIPGGFFKREGRLSAHFDAMRAFPVETNQRLH